MKRESMTFKWLKGMVLGLAFMSLAAPMVSPTWAEDAVCVFISNQGTAWVVRRDSSVKSTLNVGDPIFQGDKLFVTSGNNVQIAFDKDAQNVIQIEGNTELQIAGSKPARIDLASGKVFALLDKPGPESRFKVFTPTAVAAVRGTHFHVSYLNQMADIGTYEGKVQVNGLDATGNLTRDFVVVGPGQKTSVNAVGLAPVAPYAMTPKEMASIQEVKSNVVSTKAWLASHKADAWFGEPASKKAEKDELSGKSKMVKAKEDKSDEHQKGRIIL